MTLPGPRCTVTLLSADGVAVRARVDRVEDRRLVVRTSTAGAPPVTVAGQVTVRWPAGRRGRYTADAQARPAAGAELVVEVTGEPHIEQVRRFVRGGGGEKVWVRRAGSSEAVGGFVQDLAERGLRARFEGRHAQPGQPVVLLIELDDDSVEVTGRVLDSRVTDEVEVVFAFEPAEQQAQAIRRHVLRRQMEARARSADW